MLRVLLALLALCDLCAGNGHRRYARHAVVDVRANDDDGARRTRQTLQRHGIPVLRQSGARSWLVAATGEQVGRLKSALGARSQVRVVRRRVDTLMSAADRQVTRRRWARRSDSAGFDLRNYHSYDEIINWMKKLAVDHNDLIRYESMGLTHEGRSMPALVINEAKSGAAGRPIIWVDAGVHAREWISVAAALHTIHNITEGVRSADPLLSQFEYRIAPVLNADGYERSRTVDRLWRKNTRWTQCPVQQCCDTADAEYEDGGGGAVANATGTNATCCGQGVDLNRNFDYYWSPSGESNDTCVQSESFAGPFPGSEPEAQAISAVVSKLAKTGRLKVFLTLHSFGQLVLYPYAYAPNVSLRNGQVKHAADVVMAALNSAHGRNYTAGSPISLLNYVGSGVMLDWAYGALQLPIVITVELRPGLNDPRTFILPPSHIEPAGDEVAAAVRALAQYAADNRRSL